jgi:carbonic anhydrase/acetyltransferase-like protein (isoleucine patch superfamily)
VNRPEIHQAGVRDVEFGTGVKIVEPCNLYGCRIGDDCFVGPFTEIQKGVVIGARTRVQSHAFICELVTIGEDGFVGHGVMFVNDTF